MQRITGIVREYPWVVATLIVFVLTLGLHLAGAEDPAGLGERRGHARQIAFASSSAVEDHRSGSRVHSPTGSPSRPIAFMASPRVERRVLGGAMF